MPRLVAPDRPRAAGDNGRPRRRPSSLGARMTPPEPAAPPHIEQKSFALLLVLLSVAVAVILWPFFGAVFWAGVLALLFAPVYARLLERWRGRRILAALATLSIVLVMVILPLALVATSLLQEVTALYQRVRTGEIDFGRYFQQVVAALPAWLTGLLDRSGIVDTAVLQERLRAGLMARGEGFAKQVLGFGSDAVDVIVAFFIAMYVLFFLLLDGQKVMRNVRRAIPLQPEHKDRLLAQLAAVIRATVKGNVLVAIAQGSLGGLAFWVLGVHAPILWAVVMAFLSLLPAVGAAIIWAPVALYLLATGAVWKGVALIAFGTVVIGLVDNVLRPILVGKETKLPDYVVLISTIGGLSIFGLNGFVLGPVIVAMFIVAFDILATSRGERLDPIE
jgi:predicted PurR-regulated permease PerM